MKPRQATRFDIPAMHELRLAVRENRLTTNAVTEDHYVPAIEATGRGWVVEFEQRIVGFAVGNVRTGNIWALFVHPDHEGKGVGRALHDIMVAWLFAQGLTRLFLETEPGTRAERFYRQAGWTRVAGDFEGDVSYELFPPT